ncbi:hypothetical protein L0F63_007059, partial [Massospora cicadina]
MASKAAEKAKQKKQKEEKEEAAQEEAAKRNIEQQHEHLSSMTAPKAAQQPQDNEQW